MRPIDIRDYKNEMRRRIKEERRAMEKSKKSELDEAILQNVSRLYQYKSAKTILVYVSTDIEVDTFGIIEMALKENKKVAVPRCIPNTRMMEFHYINSFEDLSPGAFSVLEPSEDLPVVTDFSGCLMILPALSIDFLGFRLGYGKGYYDRYMSKFHGACAGICYSKNIVRRMFHGRYDRPVDVVVTDGWIKDATKYRRQGKIGLKKLSDNWKRG